MTTPHTPDDEAARELAIDLALAELQQRNAAAWADLQLDYEPLGWKLTIGGPYSVSGPGIVYYQARRGGVVLTSESIRGLRRELGLQPARPPEDGA